MVATIIVQKTHVGGVSASCGLLGADAALKDAGWLWQTSIC